PRRGPRRRPVRRSRARRRPRARRSARPAPRTEAGAEGRAACRYGASRTIRIPFSGEGREDGAQDRRTGGQMSNIPTRSDATVRPMATTSGPAAPQRPSLRKPRAAGAGPERADRAARRALDETDRQIVDALAHDGRMSIRTLAETLHISRANAYARVERLLS